MQGRIVGAGSVAYGRIPSTGSADAEILIDSSAPAGTYTGGTTLGPNTLLTARISSSGSPGSLTNGPVGTGTFVFNGGTLLLDRGSGTSIFSNTIRATADSTLNAVTHGRVLDGDIGLTVGSGTTSVGYRLSTGANSTITFSNATYSSADVGTIAFNSTTANGLTFDVTSGTSVFGGAVGELAPTEEGMVVGGSHMTKTGGGVFAARTFRSYVIEIQQPGSGTLVSTLRANQSSSGGIFGTPDFIGHIDGTIRCGSLLIASSSGVPTAVLDLQNNDMIIDWKAGANPLGTITYNSGGTTVTATGHVAQIRNAWANGSWTGTGITSGVAAANTASFAIGYADAATFYGLSPGGTATFSGQTVDDESSIFKFTYKGDFNLDGQVNVNDSGIIGANWNTDQQWTGGDANYDGRANVSDYALMAANFNAGQGAGNQLRGGEGVLPLTELYIWMLDYPQIYWESRDWTDFWDQYFAPFEGLNLGEIPARPEGMRSVPEPAALAISLLLLPRRRRK